MIAFDTPSALWSTAAASVTIDGDSWVLSNMVSAVNMRTILDHWVDELNSNWGAGAFSWSWASLDAYGGVAVTITSTVGAFDVVANADWTSLTGMASAAGVTSWTSTANPLGCWSPSLGFDVRKAGYRLAPDGDCGLGATLVRPDAPALSLGRPDVACVATFGQAYALSARLADASSPRYAWVYQRGMATWTRLALGLVSRSREGTHYRYTFAALQES
jgi:hypothetical protein